MSLVRHGVGAVGEKGLWYRGVAEGKREGVNTLGVCDLTFPARASEP